MIRNLMILGWRCSASRIALSQTAPPVKREHNVADDLERALFGLEPLR